MYLISGVCGGVAFITDLLDEGDLGEEEVAQVVPRHHGHEQDEDALL